jgi:hypothetical protein
MATEKFFVFNEDGALKRLKGRIVRFLDNEDPTGSDKSAIRTSLEVSPDAAGLVQADVGTAPNEIPVNGMLGDMAYQSSDGVSVAELQGDNIGLNASPTDARLTITDATNDCIHLTADESTIQGPYADTQIRMGGNIVVKGVNNAFLTTGSNVGLAVDSSGRVGIGTSSPGSFALGANELVVGDGAAGRGITVYGSPSTGGSLYFADGTTGTAKERGFIYYNHAADEMRFGTAADTRWTINSTGNLVAGANLGIDFGSAATSAGQGTGTTGTPANSVLSDYEYGSWEPTFKTNGTNFATMTMDVVSASYVKFGRQVICQAMIRTSNVDTTGATGVVVVDGLPFVSDSATDSHGTCTVGQAGSWVNMPEVGFTETNTAQVKLMKAGGAGFNSHLVPADFTTGATPYQNQMMFTVSYIATT